MNVRWASQVSDAERTELEHRFSLSHGELREGTTRHYELLDSSRSNIAAIIEHPAANNRFPYAPAIACGAALAVLGW